MVEKHTNEIETKLFGGTDSDDLRLAETLRQTLLRKEWLDKASEQEKLMAEDVVNYVIRQFNEASLKGSIDWKTYKIAMHNSARGLFKLEYLKHYDVAPIRTKCTEKKSIDLTNHDILFASSFNLIIFLFSRLKDGLNVKMLIEEMRSKQPIQFPRG